MENTTDAAPPSSLSSLEKKVVLITGAARRIGASTAKLLHANGANLVLHYRSSRKLAQALQSELNLIRSNSVVIIQADLLDTPKLLALVKEAHAAWDRLDVLINNASSFYPTPLGKIDESQWDDLIGSNLKAPLFLSQAAATYLTESKGCIVNIVDIHGTRPLKNFPIYSIAKAGLIMLTKSLAGELGPHVRVNAVAPGAIIWPDSTFDELTKQRILSRTILKRQGEPSDVAKAVLFLIKDASYISGHVINVDGGRLLNS